MRRAFCRWSLVFAALPMTVPACPLAAQEAATQEGPAEAVQKELQPAPARVNTAIVPRLMAMNMPRHEQFVEIAKRGDIDVLFLGDSNMDWWRRRRTRSPRRANDRARCR